MVNEDIITSLKNAIERGESLETAKSIAINSGYNSREVEEASQYVGSSFIRHENISPDRLMTMPEKKHLSFFGKSQNIKPLKPTIPIIKDSIQIPEPQKTEVHQLPREQTAMDIKNNISMNSIQFPSNNEPQKKKSFTKEIILLIILIILVGALIAVLRYKNEIINLFSNIS